MIFYVLCGHAYMALTATVRSSIHDLIWDCRHCFHEQTISLLLIGARFSDVNKQLTWGFSWLDLRFSELLHEQTHFRCCWIGAINKQLIMRIRRFLFWTVNLSIRNKPKSWWLMYLFMVTYMYVDSNCSFVYPWLIWLSALLHEQNPFFRYCWLSGFWCKTNSSLWVHPWLDLRLSAPLHEQKPFFVSVELELGFDVNKQLIMRIRRFLFWTVILNHSTPKSTIFLMCCSAVTYIDVRDRTNFFVPYPWLDLRIVGTASWTKPFFRFCWIEPGFDVNKQLIMIRRFLFWTVIPTIVPKSLIFLMCC